MTKLTDRVAAELDADGLVCAVCGEPFGCGDDVTVDGEYDCWANSKYGIGHYRCLAERFNERHWQDM